jgi:hypothetical protein
MFSFPVFSALVFLHTAGGDPSCGQLEVTCPAVFFYHHDRCAVSGTFLPLSFYASQLDSPSIDMFTALAPSRQNETQKCVSMGEKNL